MQIANMDKKSWVHNAAAFVFLKKENKCGRQLTTFILFVRLAALDCSWLELLQPSSSRATMPAYIRNCSRGGRPMQSRVAELLG